MMFIPALSSRAGSRKIVSRRNNAEVHAECAHEMTIATLDFLMFRDTQGTRRRVALGFTHQI
jgi:hypothetical protein